jgi:hypothetical protein
LILKIGGVVIGSLGFGLIMVRPFRIKPSGGGRFFFRWCLLSALKFILIHNRQNPVGVDLSSPT